MSMMQAVVLGAYGAEDKLQFVKTRQQPEVQEHSVVVEVKACALGRLDSRVRNGVYSKFTSVPCVPGYQISGVVREKGSAVKRLDVGHEVAGIVPLDCPHGGCAEYTVQDAVNFVEKPSIVTHEEAAASLWSGLEAYTAFYYQLNLKAKEFILIISPTTGADTLAIQLAGSVGAKVIVTATSTEQLNLFGDCGNHVVRVVDLHSESLLEEVMKETGGLGVNCVWDRQDHHNAPRDEDVNTVAAVSSSAQQTNSDTPAESKGGVTNASSSGHAGSSGSAKTEQKGSGTPSTPPKSSGTSAGWVTKTEIIQCLAVQGRWLTEHSELQLDPPDNQQLFYRNASVSFLFAPSWLLAPHQHGKYLHILQDLLDKLSKGTVKACIQAPVFSLAKIRQAHRQNETETVGKVVIRV